MESYGASGEKGEQSVIIDELTFKVLLTRL